MSTIITVEKVNLSRCDYTVSVIRAGKQVRKDEVSGCAGNAAAKAINFKAAYGASKIVGPTDVVNRT